jgi:hypothetical protein
VRPDPLPEWCCFSQQRLTHMGGGSERETRPLHVLGIIERRKMNDTPRVVDSPDVIYLVYGDLNYAYRDDATHRQLMNEGDVGWCEDQIDKTDIKYVRADLYEQQSKEIEALRNVLSEVVEWAERHKWPSHPLALSARRALKGE